MGQPQNLLIVGYDGIGNGICLVPVLHSLERHDHKLRCFVSGNGAFDDPELLRLAGLQNLAGTVPAAWRRFVPEHWKAIEAFLRANDIHIVANLRNGGEARDSNFNLFQHQSHKGRAVFWSLADLGPSTLGERLAIQDHLDLFRWHGIGLTAPDPYWLRARIPSARRQRIGLRVGCMTGASLPKKRWPARRWIDVCTRLAKTADVVLEIYGGWSAEEVDLANEVWHALPEAVRGGRAALFIRQPIMELCERVAQLDLLISNDTAAVHIAAALNVSTIGLYLATNARVWGGFSDRFVPFQGSIGSICPQFRPTFGNCDLYYADCPAPCTNDIDPEQVLTVCRGRLAELGTH